MRFASAAPTAGAALALSLALNWAAPAAAQTLDRYGGGAALPPPAYAPIPGQGAPGAYPTVTGYPPAPSAVGAPGGYPAPAYPSMAVYGRAPSGYGQAAPRPMAATRASAGLRTLSWPGKEQAQAVAPPQPVGAGAYRGATPTYALAPAPMPRYAPSPTDGRLQPRPYSQPQTSPSAYAPTPGAAYAFAAPPQAAAPRPAAPASIYSDAPVAPTPQPYAYAPAAYGPASAVPPQPPMAPAPTAASGGSRQYSVHAQYGLTPDPAPIPPQFFANTADLSAPETPDVVTPPRVTGSATAVKASENAARLAASAVQ